MTKLPSPIPHPLSFLDAPGWLREALEWVVGFDWPAGDEKAMRQLADAWYEAGRRVGPLLEESDQAALEAVAAFAGPEGEAAQALLALWRKLGGSVPRPDEDTIRWIFHWKGRPPGAGSSG